jgi:hypothetical protein
MQKCLADDRWQVVEEVLELKLQILEVERKVQMLEE